MNIRSILSEIVRGIINHNYGFSDTIFNDAENRINILTDMIINWENTHNIISNKSSVDFVFESIVDSLSLGNLRYFKENNNKTIYDIGSGGGFPSLPLAIIYHDINFILIEKDRKKCSFLRLAKARLNLNNVVIVNKRVEDITLGSTIITRAAFSPSGIRLILPLVACGSRLIIWATLKNKDEFVRIMSQYNFFLSEHHLYTLPQGQNRILLVLVKNGST